MSQRQHTGGVTSCVGLEGMGEERQHCSPCAPALLGTAGAEHPLFAEAGWEGNLEDRLIPRQISSGHKLGENSFF